LSQEALALLRPYVAGWKSVTVVISARTYSSNAGQCVRMQMGDAQGSDVPEWRFSARAIRSAD
jgi:hypothetical protein